MCLVKTNKANSSFIDMSTKFILDDLLGPCSILLLRVSMFIRSLNDNPPSLPTQTNPFYPINHFFYSYHKKVTCSLILHPTTYPEFANIHVPLQKTIANHIKSLERI